MTTIRTPWWPVWFGALMLALSLSAPAHAQHTVSPVVKKMLGSLPIDGLKGEVDGLVAALQKTSCGGGLAGCYAAKKTIKVPSIGDLPVQLYFFTSDGIQQTLLLVLDRKVAMPGLLKPEVQKLFAGTSLTAPIFSVSTTDFSLATANMPADLRSIVGSAYFGIDSISFNSGVQFAGRGHIGGLMRTVIEKTWNVPVDAFLLKAGVVLPIPTDLQGAAGTAETVREAETMKKGLKDAAAVEAYVEFQLAPGQMIRNPMGMQGMQLTDATLFLNNALTLGYQGNVSYDGIPGKTVIMFFRTPLTPLGVMDLADFQFGLAMPPSFTLEDYAYVSTGFASTTMTGGGFIKGINQIKAPLMMAAKPLSVFQLVNPVPPAPYKFGDKTKPFPTLDKFNVMLLGPLASGGPVLKVASNARILGLTMGRMDVLVNGAGFNGEVTADVRLKMGPLGKTGFKMVAQANITEKQQLVRLKGNVLGRVLELVLNGNELSMDSPATCATPFEIKARATITPTLNVEQLLDLQGGANVDPAKLQGCVGKDLEAAYKWVGSTGKNLAGYSANQANQELNKISKAAEAEYNRAKDAARNAASQTSSGAMKAFNDAGNAFKKLGGKKHKHKSGPDPKFSASVFDWDYYYDQYPDVVRAGVDLATHWRDNGYGEGRQGSPEFSVKYYGDRYSDLIRYCGAGPGGYNCLLQHWLDHGIAEGRQGSAGVSMKSYLARYPDLQRAFGAQNYADAMDHWLNHGEDEGRNPRP